jgi:hypothetical protein
MIAKKAPALKTAPAAGGSTHVAPPQLKTKPPMLDAKGRALPPDVRAIVSNLGPTGAKDL